MARQLCISTLVSFLTVLLLGGPQTAAAAGEYALPAETKEAVDNLPDARTKAEYLEGVSAKLGKDPAFHFELGNAYFDLSQFETAEEHFKRALDLAPDYLGAAVNLGSVYDELGRLDDALKAYKVAMKISPNEEKTLCNIGGVYFQKRQISQALWHFNKAVELYPDSQLAHYNLAILFADSKIYREAIVEWQRVVEIDAGNDLGTRSADNIEIIKQMQSLEVGDADHSGHDH